MAAPTSERLPRPPPWDPADLGEVYATLPFTPNGQLAFAPNGTLYVVSGYNNSAPSVVRVGGTDTPAPIAVALPGVVTDFWVGIGELKANGDAKSLILHDTTGLQLVDITATPPTKTLLATGPIGAGRTGPDGCLYAGSSDAVLKLTDPTGGCSFSPSIASPSLGLTPAAIAPDPPQGDARTFTATIRNLDAPAGTPIRFQVSGANTQVELVRTDANRQARLTYTAMKTGRDTIVATTAVGATA